MHSWVTMVCIQENSGQSKGNRAILKNISTYFRPGQLVAIMGLSGSGKTTFLDCIAGRQITGTQQVSNIAGVEYCAWLVFQ